MSSVLKEQVGGDHYKQFPYQPMTFFERYNVPFSFGNAMKYILRYPYKNGIEDLKKALHCLKFISEVNGEGHWTNQGTCYGGKKYPITFEYKDALEFVEKNQKVIEGKSKGWFLSLCKFLLYNDFYYLRIVKVEVRNEIKRLENEHEEWNIYDKIV